MVVVFGVPKCIEGGDDSLQMPEDLAVIVGETVMAVGFGRGDQLGGLVGLSAVGGQEFDGGLKIGTRQAGVGMRTILLRWSAAEAVWEAGLDAAEVVLDPLGIGGGSDWVVGEALTINVHPPLAVSVEGLSNGSVVQP